MRAASGANLGRPLFLVIGPSEVRATSGANLGRPLFLVVNLSSFLATVVQNPRRGCRRVPKCCMGSYVTQI